MPPGLRRLRLPDQGAHLGDGLLPQAARRHPAQAAPCARVEELYRHGGGQGDPEVAGAGVTRSCRVNVVFYIHHGRRSVDKKTLSTLRAVPVSSIALVGWMSLFTSTMGPARWATAPGGLPGNLGVYIPTPRSGRGRPTACGY